MIVLTPQYRRRVFEELTISQRCSNPAGEKSFFNEPTGGKLTPVGNELAPALEDVCKATLEVTVERGNDVRDGVETDDFCAFTLPDPV